MLSRLRERTLGPGGLCSLLDAQVGWSQVLSRVTQGPLPRRIDQLVVWEGEFIGLVTSWLGDWLGFEGRLSLRSRSSAGGSHQ